MKPTSPDAKSDTDSVLENSALGALFFLFAIIAILAAAAALGSGALPSP